MTQPAIKLPDAIVTLNDEHRYMNLLLGTMEERLGETDLAAEGDLFLLQDIVHYMHEYPDTAHHPTEDLMFDILVKRNPAHELDVARLRREHQLLRENTADILRLLDAAAKRRSARTIGAVRSATADYVTRLRQHMLFEETELFPSAVRCLASRDWHAIEVRLGAAEDPLFGPTVERDYRVLYEYFAGRAEQVSRQMTRFGILQLDNLILSADAIEAGIREALDLFQDRGAFVVAEFRTVSGKVFDGRGPVAALGLPIGYAAIVGKTAVEVGARATGIYLRTCKNAVVAFIRGAG